MTDMVLIEMELPAEMAAFRLPEGVHRRLQELLNRQDSGTPLTPEERLEAEGFVDLAEFLSLLRMRAQRLAREVSPPEYRGELLGGLSPDYLGERAKRKMRK